MKGPKKMNLKEICEKRNYLKPSKVKQYPDVVAFTVPQMAELLQLSEATVRRLIQERNVPTIEGTKKIRVTRKNFELYLLS